MKRYALSLLVLLLAACGPSEEERRAAAEAAMLARMESEATEQLVQYEQHLAAGNVELAAAYGEVLLARYPNTQAAAKIKPGFPEVKAKADALKEKRRLESLWIYQTSPMGGGVQKTAVIYSDDPGTPRVRLIVRQHTEWGQSVFLLPDAELFKCDRCDVKIAVDGGEPKAWHASGSSDKNNPAMFIDEDAAFIALLDEAERIRIEVPTADGTRELHFEVGGFDPPRYKAGK